MQNTRDSYLVNPAGKYGVGCLNDIVEDAKYGEEGSSDHKIFIKVYYPIESSAAGSSEYSKQQMDVFKKNVCHVDGVSDDDISKLDLIKSFAVENAEIISVGGKFPLILFSPGAGYPAQGYENILLSLVCQGYVVVGINTLHLNIHPNEGNEASPPESPQMNEQKQLRESQITDLLAVLDFLQNRESSQTKYSNVYERVCLDKVGIMGHSCGGNSIVSLALSYPDKFSAALSLDYGADSLGLAMKPFEIPFMHILSSSRFLAESYDASDFELTKDTYLIQVTDDVANLTYTQHCSFSDKVTLQYHPTYKKVLTVLDKVTNSPGVEILDTPPSESKIQQYQNRTYALIGKGQDYQIKVFENGGCSPSYMSLKVENIPGLSLALNTLSNESDPQLSGKHTAEIQKVIEAFNQDMGYTYGTGNGWDIAQTTNAYVLAFFDTYLTGDVNDQLSMGVKLADNSIVTCSS